MGVARVRIPPGGPWATVAEALAEVTGQPELVAAGVAAGEVVVDDGVPGSRGLVVDAATEYLPTGPRRRVAWLYRPYPTEPEVPGGLPVLQADEHCVVVDKPPFLATIPRGVHVQQTVVARVREDFPEAVPVHRLDRLTSGVLLCARTPDARRPLQQLFEQRRVTKAYEAVVSLPAQDTSGAFRVSPGVAGLGLGERVERAVGEQEHQLVKKRGNQQVAVVPGPPNALTRIEAVEVDEAAGRARLRLHPHTGRTHQLRVQLAHLGLPIVGDPLYPVQTEQVTGDFSKPLQLLATRLEWTDPWTGEARRAESRSPLLG
ncbi:tRNA pseudouridine32 synthase / 23S rRNA pseudouridine746 synthase [Kytococcus aerolatus]|uniref:RNA pseudouridylate synthase n=1 Tax=Kytococcus aerolatus TaxID=592308 RepID=A0A212U023_9MICO|nr:pseudouridine synthase [Kytococcus aerolatus]SNC71588.1 tRNA pseudouridine32 synthase / 23S rRNA pseudouridine746 synthase [Kytococcus aerolatus]